MNVKISWLCIVVSTVLLCFISGFGILVKTSFGDIPSTEIPLFEVLGKEITAFEGGVNITLTFRNYGYNATSGTVWMPWENVWYGTSLEGVTPNGNITEALLPYDVNGDGDASDVFTVGYIDNETVQVDGVTAYAMDTPNQRIYYNGNGRYDVLEKNSFTLGSKNLTLYRVWYSTEMDYGYAGFGIDSFFHDHPSPNIEFVIEQAGTSINSDSTAEIASMELNGSLTPYEFNWILPWLDSPVGKWYVDNVYVYPLGFLANNTIFTVKICILGEPGCYVLTTILNWTPDALHRYRYFVFPFVEIPFAITGATARTVDFGGEIYHIEFFTNSTVSPTIAFDPEAKEIRFNVTYYGGPGGSKYFWNVTIPRNFLSDNPWNVTLAGTPMTFISTSNGTYSFVYFEATLSETWEFATGEVSVEGTWAVPEFPSSLILPLLMIATLLATTFCKRKYSMQLHA